ncbi:MAG: helix-turn-helix domain-containing protein, partial [Candidatus Dormibacteria bacterium]
REVPCRGQNNLLSPLECRLLRYLMLNPNRVLSKAQIQATVWEGAPESRSDVAATLMCYLRKKLDLISGPEIRTVPQRGYVLQVRV